MLKNFCVLVLLSLGVVLGMRHIEPVLMCLITIHSWLLHHLLHLFVAGGKVGLVVKSLLSLMIIPLLTACFPALIYWMAKNRFFPYFMHVMWTVWLLQTTALVALYHVNF